MAFTLSLAGKTALLTGGSNGIGAAIARAYAAAGASVAFTYRNARDGAEQVAADIAAQGVKAHAIHADLAQPGATERVWQEALALTGQIDVLVNNAGTITRSAFLAITQEELDRVMAVNFQAPWQLTRKLAEHLIARKAPGSVVNVSSVSAHFARSRMAHYQCSKAALHMLTRSVAYELAPHGIRANSISAGLTQSNTNRDQWEGNPAIWAERSRDIPLGRTGMPRDYAGLAVFLASDEASWITGADITVDGGSSVI